MGCFLMFCKNWFAISCYTYIEQRNAKYHRIRCSSNSQTVALRHPDARMVTQLVNTRIKFDRIMSSLAKHLIVLVLYVQMAYNARKPNQPNQQMHNSCLHFWNLLLSLYEGEKRRSPVISERSPDQLQIVIEISVQMEPQNQD